MTQDVFWTMNITTSKESSPLLKPEHFEGLSTQLTEQGIRFDGFITKEDREFECNENSQELQESRLSYLETLALLRDQSTVSINPSSHSASKLLDIFRDTEIGESHVSIEYGIPNKFDVSWMCASEYDLEKTRYTEGQNLVLVIYENEDPIGFQSFDCRITYPFKDRLASSFLLMIDLTLAFVLPSHRNKGYGLDLSLACGRVLSDILCALYAAVPDGAHIDVTINSDYDSDGGERMAEQIRSCLEGEVDSLVSLNSRPSVTVNRSIEMDTGF